jgi:cellulose synthase/poly-beta-1,6-N-acetylglucosamine synthase-like glycosyltransferase
MYSEQWLRPETITGSNYSIFGAAFAVTVLTILNVFCNAPVQISILKSTRQRWSKYGLFLLRYKPYNILVRKLTTLGNSFRHFIVFSLIFINIWLQATPSPVSKLSLSLSLPECRPSSLLKGERGRRWGRSQIIRRRRNMALYKLFNTLCIE